MTGGDTVELFHDTDGGTDTRFWMLHDYLGSTRQIVTDVTNPQTDKRLDYTAFGTVDSESGNNNSKSPYRYAGNWGYYDGSGRSATTTADGLILCGHRWYDPSIGRWLTEDPIGFEGGWNLYGYVANCPTTFVDPPGTNVDFRPPGWPRWKRWPPRPDPMDSPSVTPGEPRHTGPCPGGVPLYPAPPPPGPDWISIGSWTAGSGLGWIGGLYGMTTDLTWGMAAAGAGGAGWGFVTLGSVYWCRYWWHKEAYGWVE